MITRVFGKVIENIYEVDDKLVKIKDSNEKEKYVYKDKPILTKISKVKSWSELCSYEGEPRYNSSLHASMSMYSTLNISENETVRAEEKIFRADLNEVHLHTDKVVDTIDVNKEREEKYLEVCVKAFNKMMIESNSKLKDYCDIHGLSYEDTDCIKLFNIVFPNEEFEIVNGVMKVVDQQNVVGKAYPYTIATNNPVTISYGDYCTVGIASRTEC